MPGIKTRLVDLLKSFEKLKSQESKKRERISELRHSFLQKGYSPWMATKLAEEQTKKEMI